MSRQVLTYPDIPAVLTQSAGDARYLQQGTADGRYLQLTGGTLSGVLALNGVAAGRAHRLQYLRSGAMTWAEMLGPSDELEWWEKGLSASRMTLTQAGELTVTPGTGYAVTVQAGGLRVHGSALGYTGEILFHNTAAAGLYGIATLASGAPRMLFDHRATSNTGDWVWRNGTGAGAVKMLLAGNGALTITPDAESAGMQCGPAFGNQTWISSTRSDGRMVMNTGASGLHQWAFGPWLAGTVKMSLNPNGQVSLGSARGDQPAVVFGESTMLIKNDGVFGLMEIRVPAYGIDTYVADVRTYMIRSDAIAPMPDNSRYCGTGVNRWIAVYAVAGAINTSSAEVKEITGTVDDAQALAQLMSLPSIYRFYYKHNNEDGELVTDTSMEFLGPIAEEMPADMKVGATTVGSVNTEGHLMASLRGSVKEHRAQIAALMKRIEALEAARV